MHPDLYLYLQRQRRQELLRSLCHPDPLRSGWGWRPNVSVLFRAVALVDG